jgi:hypothetical protein
MSTEAHFIEQIVADIHQRQQDAERNYKVFKNHWENLNKECADLVNAGFVLSSPEIQDNHENRHAAFEVMRKLDNESTACLKALDALSVLR